MKRLLPLVLLLLWCLNVAVGQGVRGKVQLPGKTIVVATGHGVALSWNSSQGAASYNVYRGLVHGGPYTKIASGLATPSYADGFQIVHGQTFYYVVTAVDKQGESPYSNESVATIP